MTIQISKNEYTTQDGDDDDDDDGDTTTTTTTTTTNNNNNKCRLCKQYEETIDHLTSGCPNLTKNEYLMRHDKVCTHLRYSICKALGTETTDKWYKHTCPSQCMKREMSQCCGIKKYTQTEKLQQIGQI